MKSGKPAVPDLPVAVLQAYDINDRINHYLVTNLPLPVWRMSPPGGKGRAVAEIVAHIHNVRLMWLKSISPTGAHPAKLEGDTFAPADALASLAASAASVRVVALAALSGDGRVRGFKPDVAAFLAYHVAHDAHHRGQITLMCRLLGHPVAQKIMYGMWEWGSR